MRILRIILGVLIVLFCAMGAFSMGGTALYKLDPSPNVPEMAQRMIPLFEATPWWQLAVWFVFWVAMLAAAWRLFTGGKAFALYAIAAAGGVLSWWFMSRLPAYSQVFTPAELTMDYYIFAAQAVVGALIWFSERKGRRGELGSVGAAGIYGTPGVAAYGDDRHDGGHDGGGGGGGSDGGGG